MKRCLHIVSFLIGLAMLVACSKPAEVPEPVVAEPCRSVEGQILALSQIDTLMWHHPDSALAVMMEFTASPKADSMDVFEGHYCQVLIAELLFKNDYGQSNREEVLKAVGYFDSIDDGFLAARAHYINGVGFYEQGDLANACTEYLNTLRIMESHFSEKELVDKKARFMAYTYNRLGDLFSAQFMQEPAIYCYKQALVYNRIAPTSPYGSSNNLYRIGKQYSKLHEADSAAYYFDMALECLSDRNNMIYRDIVAYRALSEFTFHGDAITALDSLKSMAAKAENETERLNRYRTIGGVYCGLEQYDSAKFYLMPVLEKDPNGALLAAKYLKDIALKEGDTLKANEYALILANEGASAAENQAQVSKLNDMFQNYLQEKQETALALERLETRRRNLWAGGMVALLAIVGLAVAIVTRRSHRKRLEAQQAEAQQRLEAERQSHRIEQAALSGRLKRSNETLRELQDQIRQQDDSEAMAKTQAASFAEEPICQLIMQRVNEGQFKSQMDCTIYKDYALGKEQVTALREAADRHFGQFTSRLAKAYPELTRGDLDYCCLYLLGLSDADVAALMQRAYNTVSQRARKMKAIFGNEEPLPTILCSMANGSTHI